MNKTYITSLKREIKFLEKKGYKTAVILKKIQIEKAIKFIERYGSIRRTTNNKYKYEVYERYGFKYYEFCKDWKKISKSPYSFSYYSSNDIDWDYKPEGSYRISDHWNFNGHCRTNKRVEMDKELYLDIACAKYNKGIYEVIS